MAGMAGCVGVGGLWSWWLLILSPGGGGDNEGPERNMSPSPYSRFTRVSIVKFYCHPPQQCLERTWTMVSSLAALSNQILASSH